MGNDTPVAMDAEERDEFLRNGGTGVLSLSTTGEEAPYAVPVSYGYDAAEGTFYFRLAVGHDSEKGDLADRAVTFVAYGPDGESAGTEGDEGDDDASDERWHSVVARGRLESVDEEDVATDSLAGLERVDIPLVDVFDETIRSTNFEFYRLRPEQFTGRKEVRRSG